MDTGMFSLPRRRLALVALAVAAAASLSGCYQATAGEVHNMDTSPGHYYTTLVCPKSCVPVTSYMPPSWSLDIYVSKDDHGWIDVPQDVYSKCHVGDYWAEKSGCETR